MSMFSKKKTTEVHTIPQPDAAAAQPQVEPAAPPELSDEDKKQLVVQGLTGFIEGYRGIVSILRRPVASFDIKDGDAITGRYRFVTSELTRYESDHLVLYSVASVARTPLKQGALPQPFGYAGGLDDAYDLGDKVKDAFAKQDEVIQNSRKPVNEGAVLIADLQKVNKDVDVDRVTALYEKLNALPGVEYVVNAAGLVSAARDEAGRLARLATDGFEQTENAIAAFKTIADNTALEGIGEWHGVLPAALAAQLRLCGLARYDYKEKKLVD